jgi:hypothetical protein
VPCGHLSITSTNIPSLPHSSKPRVDSALRSACAKEDLKWVSLLVWAGADPRSSGPAVDEQDPTNPEHFTTAMHDAAYAEDVKVLKRLKPDPQQDDVGAMLKSAARFSNVDTIRYLVEGLGVSANDKPNGGSTALDGCLTSFRSAVVSYHIRNGSSIGTTQKVPIMRPPNASTSCGCCSARCPLAT